MATWRVKMRMFSINDSARTKPRNSTLVTFVLKGRGIHPRVPCETKSSSGSSVTERAFPCVVSAWKIYFTKRPAWALVFHAAPPGSTLSVSAVSSGLCPSKRRRKWQVEGGSLWGIGWGRLSCVWAKPRAPCGFPPRTSQQVMLPWMWWSRTGRACFKSCNKDSNT